MTSQNNPSNVSHLTCLFLRWEPGIWRRISVNGAQTFSIKDLIMTLTIECHYTEWRIFIVILSVVRPNKAASWFFFCFRTWRSQLDVWTTRYQISLNITNWQCLKQTCYLYRVALRQAQNATETCTFLSFKFQFTHSLYPIGLIEHTTQRMHNYY